MILDTVRCASRLPLLVACRGTSETCFRWLALVGAFLAPQSPFL